MTLFEWIFGFIIIALSIVLVVAVLMQSGKEKGLSGSIVGGAESFFGKGKGNSKDRFLSKLIASLGILFAVIAIVMYVVIAASH